MDKLFLAMSFPDLLAKLGSQNILCGSFWPFSFAAYCDKCGRLRQCHVTTGRPVGQMVVVAGLSGSYKHLLRVNPEKAVKM